MSQGSHHSVIIREYIRKLSNMRFHICTQRQQLSFNQLSVNDSLKEFVGQDDLVQMNIVELLHEVSGRLALDFIHICLELLSGD